MTGSSYTFTCNSSSGDDYRVRAYWDDQGHVTKLECDCRGFKFGDACKHVLAFFVRDGSLLCDDSQFERFAQVVEMLVSSPLADAYDDMKEAIAANEEAASLLKARNAEAKREFVKKLRGTST